MLTAKQIANIIRAEMAIPEDKYPGADLAAEKIVAALPDYNQMAVSASALENEVTSTLLDMAVATVLATLIEEEGTGRSNVSISPLSMDHMVKNYRYTVEMDGMIRTVRIEMREDSDLQTVEGWREPSNRHGLVDKAEQVYRPEDLAPQAEPKVFDRPVWVVRVPIEGEEPYLRECNNQEDANLVLKAVAGSHPLARIENRFCLHPDCPTSGCNYDTALRDKPEVASE